MNYFNSRDSYLALVAEWKAKYAQLTVDQRTAKLALRAGAAKFSKSYNGKSYPEHANRYSLPDYRDLMPLICAVQDLKRKANEMLEARAAGKIVAQQQYLAGKISALAPV